MKIFPKWMSVANWQVILWKQKQKQKKSKKKFFENNINNNLNIETNIFNVGFSFSRGFLQQCSGGLWDQFQGRGWSGKSVWSPGPRTQSYSLRGMLRGPRGTWAGTCHALSYLLSPLKGGISLKWIWHALHHASSATWLHCLRNHHQLKSKSGLP